MVSVVFEFFEKGMLDTVFLDLLISRKTSIDLNCHFSLLCNIPWANITQCMHSSVDGHFGSRFCY